MSWKALFCMKDELERIAYPKSYKFWLYINHNLQGLVDYIVKLDLKPLNGLH